MNVAVVGVGRMGRRHLQALCELGQTIVGICDPSPESLALAQTEQGIGADRHFRDFSEMLTRTTPESLIVATTAPTHADYVCHAAERGVRYILCEKPMATSLADCDRMLRVCRERGTILAINHQMRFMEQYTSPKRIVDSAQFGGLSSVTVVAGNFGVAMNGTHYFEMFRYLTGEAASEVSAWLSDRAVPNPRGPHFEDRAGSVRLTTPAGKRYYMEVGDDQGYGMHVTYAGPLGRLTVDELTGTAHLAVREEQYRDLPTTRYGMPAVETAWRLAPADVVGPTKAVLQALFARKNYPSGEDGRLAIATLVAAYVSHEQGHRPVRLSEALPVDRHFPWA
jgi:predicted dehydrogenase